MAQEEFFAEGFAGRTGFMFKASRSELDGRLQPYGLYAH